MGFAFSLRFGLAEARQRRITERAVYRATITVADKSLENGDVGDVQHALDQAPAHLRGWEWDHLERRANARAVTTPAAVPGSHEQCVGWTEDGTPIAVVASALDDRVLTITHIETREVIQEVVGDGALTPVALGDGGRLLAGACFPSRLLHIWNLDTGKRVLTHELSTVDGDWTRGARHLLRNCAFSEDGSLFALANKSNAMVVEVETGRTRVQYSASGCMATSPSGDRLFLHHGNGRGALFDLDSGEVLLEKRALTPPSSSWSFEVGISATWSPDGSMIALRGKTHEFILLKAQDLEIAAVSPKGPPGPDLAFFPDGRRLAVGRVDSVRIWDLCSDRSIEWRDASLRPKVADDSIGSAPLLQSIFVGPARQLAVSPDGRQLCAASDQGHALISVSRSAAICVLEPSYVYFNAWSPDGRILATGGWSRSIYLWESHSGELLRALPFDEQVVRGLGFSEDGAFVVAASVEAGVARVHVWDTATGERVGPVHSTPEPGQMVSHSAFWQRVRGGSGMSAGQTGIVARKSLLGGLIGSTDEVSLGHAKGSERSGELTLSADGGLTRLPSIAAFPPGTDRELSPPDQGLPGVTAVALSPDDRTVAAFGVALGDASSHDFDQTGFLRLFDIDSGDLVTETPLHLAYSLDYHPDGSRIAAGLENGRIAILDAETLETLLELEGHADYVFGVGFSPDGSRLASSSGDGSTLIWDTEDASVRYSAAAEAQRVRREMEPVVRDLLERLDTAAEAAAYLRADTALSDAQRGAGLMEILRR